MFVFVLNQIKSNQIKLSLAISLMASDDKNIMIYVTTRESIILYLLLVKLGVSFVYTVPHDNMTHNNIKTFGCHPHNVFFPNRAVSAKVQKVHTAYHNFYSEKKPSNHKVVWIVIRYCTVPHNHYYLSYY